MSCLVGNRSGGLENASVELLELGNDHVRREIHPTASRTVSESRAECGVSGKFGDGGGQCPQVARAHEESINAVRDHVRVPPRECPDDRLSAAHRFVHHVPAQTTGRSDPSRTQGLASTVSGGGVVQGASVMVSGHGTVTVKLRAVDTVGNAAAWLTTTLCLS